METKKIIKWGLVVLILVGLASIIFFRKNDNEVGLSKIEPALLKTEITGGSNAYATLSLTPASSNVIVGENFSLEAKINPNGGAGINAVGITINYPISGIECSSFTVNNSSWLTLLSGKTDNTVGTAIADVGAFLDNRDGIKTETVVATLTCKAKTAGTHKFSFDETKTAVYAVGEANLGKNVLASTSSATVTATTSDITSPTVDSATFSPASISAGQSSLLSWSTSNADGVYVTCKGSNGVPIEGINNLQVPTSQMTSYTTSPYEDLIAYGNKITCTFYAYKGNTKSTSSKDAVLELKGGSPTVDSATFSPASISAGQSSLLSWSTSNADGVYVTCKGSNGVPIEGINNLQVPTSQMTSYGPLLYENLISLGNKITCTFYAYKGNTKSTSSKDAVLELKGGSPTVDSATFSPASISAGQSSLLSWSTSNADGVYVTCKGSNGVPIEGINNLQVPTSQMTSYGPLLYENLISLGNKITCTFYAYKGNTKSTSSKDAVLSLITETSIVNGVCGSANGTTVSSVPTSNLCSAGNASLVSGSGPWTWTCLGSNGGTNASCSANKETTATASTTYTYSPTTSVIPVTEYTYSYTSKVAPASGPVTNVVLLLSVSAVITLGVWVVMKKIKD